MSQDVVDEGGHDAHGLIRGRTVRVKIVTQVYISGLPAVERFISLAVDPYGAWGREALDTSNESLCL